MKFKFNNTEVYMDGTLAKNLETWKNNIKQDRDYMLIVDGKEGSGKSTIAQQIAAFLDKNFSINNIAFTDKEFLDKVKDAEKYSCVLFDEAYGALSSKESLSQRNKTLVRLFTRVRHQNLFMIIVLPSFFDLTKYVALWRSSALIHVYEHKQERGYFTAFNYNKKNSLYMKGRKFYSYGSIKSDWIGRFGKNMVVDKTEYEKKKLSGTYDSEEEENISKKEIQRNKAIHLIKKELQWTDEEISNKIDISRRRISEILQKKYNI